MLLVTDLGGAVGVITVIVGLNALDDHTASPHAFFAIQAGAIILLRGGRPPVADDPLGEIGCLVAAARVAVARPTNETSWPTHTLSYINRLRELLFTLGQDGCGILIFLHLETASCKHNKARVHLKKHICLAGF